MGRRLYSRHGNGRFRRATLENTFGLSAPTCPECGRFNPHGVGEPAPETCHACGASMTPSPVPGGHDPATCRNGDHYGQCSGVTLPAFTWPCGCLKNDAGAHRVGCPDHPEGVRGS